MRCSLLQLFRQRMPELLHKKYRGRGADLSVRPGQYGAVQAATGVEGAELLAAREAKLAARGDAVDRDEVRHISCSSYQAVRLIASGFLI